MSKMALNSHSGLIAFVLALPVALLFGSLAALVPYWFIVAVIIVPIMGLIAFTKPHWAAVFLVIFASGVIPPQFTPTVSVLGGTVRSEDIFLVMLLGVSLVSVLFGKNRFSEFGSDLFRPYYFFAFMVIFSLVLSLVLYGNQVKYVAYEFRVCIYWVFGVLLYFSIKDEKSLSWVVNALVLMSVLLSIVVIVQSVTGWQILSHARVESLDNAGVVLSDVKRSTFGGFQNFVVFSLVILLVRMSTGNIRSIIALPLLAVLITGLIVTFGRGVWAAAMVSIVVASLFLGWRGFVRINLFIVAVSVVVGVAVALIQPVILDAVVDRVLSVNRDLEGGESWRWRQVENEYALKKISEHPVVGIGLGGEYQPIRNQFMSPEQTRMMHNSYLYLILKFGLLGIVFPIWVCMLVWRECFRLLKPVQGCVDRSLVIAVGAVMFLPILTGFTQPEWMEHKGVLFISTLVGLLAASKKLYKPVSSESVEDLRLYAIR